jgi:outer membrane protein
MHRAKNISWSLVLLTAVCWSQQTPVPPTTASTTAPLSLEQAESTAIANQPRLLAAQLRAKEAEQRIRETRAGLFPTTAFNASGVLVADAGTTIGAGNITTSSISDRFGYGENLTQMVTDFGRTSSLIRSSRYKSQASADQAVLTRAQVRLNVEQAFYSVLGAEAVLRAAQAAQGNRQLVSRQLSALAQSELKSTLDVNFAKVLESEADLAVVRAQSEVEQARSHLATAMGVAQVVQAPLVDPVTPAEPPAPDALQQQAQTLRADLSADVDQQKAAQEFALAEKRLSYPTLNALASAGQIPFHDHTLHANWAAAGFNLSIPVFNGGLFSARRNEAALEANARTRDVEDARLVVNEQVRDAWYQVDEAYRSLDVSARLVTQSREALRLAQDRYDAGLGSIVELNEAQLNETSAEISSADAKYTYLSRLAALDFAAGLLN